MDDKKVQDLATVMFYFFIICIILLVVYLVCSILLIWGAAKVSKKNLEIFAKIKKISIKL